jgi:hypothetical protein
MTGNVNIYATSHQPGDLTELDFMFLLRSWSNAQVEAGATKMAHHSSPDQPIMAQADEERGRRSFLRKPHEEAERGRETGIEAKLPRVSHPEMDELDWTGLAPRYVAHLSSCCVTSTIGEQAHSPS